LLTTTSVAPVDDGVLRLGILLPSGGAGAELGQALSDGIALALTEINTSGGVNGEPVRRIVRSEGDDIIAATSAMQALVDAGVDAIVGPASSNNTLAALGTAVAAGRVTCSPTASAMALDAYPDNGLFFRTIPSDSLQAWAIARAADQTGTSRVTIAYIDDAYGRPFADQVAIAVATLGIAVSAEVPYTRAEASITDAARTVADGAPRSVVVIGDSATGPAMLTAIDLATGDGAVTYVVNDAMRRPAATVQPFTPEVASRIVGVSPRATTTNSAFLDALLALNPRTSGLYAANAYNCVNLIALAATMSGSTLPQTIARTIPTVSVNGSRCTDFPSCAELLRAGRNIDYEGPNGELTIGSDGERVAADFDLFGFDDSGRDVTRGQITIFRP
jgi:branched-chain amino acid transport system substrate-binding protein